MNFEVGKRYFNRAGAVLRVTYIDAQVIHTHTKACLKAGCKLAEGWPYIVAVVELTPDGEVPESECRIGLCPDGRYFLDAESDVDLIREVVDVNARAA